MVTYLGGIPTMNVFVCIISGIFNVVYFRKDLSEDFTREVFQLLFRKSSSDYFAGGPIPTRAMMSENET